jgi:hypothetical protein
MVRTDPSQRTLRWSTPPIIICGQVVFLYASEGSLSVLVLFHADLGLLLSGYAVWSATDPKTPGAYVGRLVRLA